MNRRCHKFIARVLDYKNGYYIFMAVKLAMKPIPLLIIITLLSIQATASHSDNPEPARDSITIKKLIADIASENTFEVASAYHPQSLQTKRALLLDKQGAFDLLKLCMENSNAVVRLYAFKALADKMDNMPKELVEKFQKDQTKVTIKTLKGNIERPVWQVANGFLK